MQERTKQGGSVLVFGIIAIVLAAAVIGLVFLVNQRANNNLAGPLFDMPEQSEESNSSEGEANQADESDPDSSASDNASKDEPSGEPSTDSGDTNDDKSGEVADEPAASEAPADDKSGTEDKEALPATGPAENVISGAMLAIMFGLAVAYSRSAA